MPGYSKLVSGWHPVELSLLLLLLAETAESHGLAACAIEGFEGAGHPEGRDLSITNQLLALDHGALLLLIPAVPSLCLLSLLLPIINNLKVNIILHVIGFNGGSPAIRKRRAVILQQKRLLSDVRSHPDMTVSTLIGRLRYFRFRLCG